MARSPEEVVREFCAAWSRRDLDEIMGYFTDDAVYHNMPGPPIQGKETIRRSIESFLKGWTGAQWDVLNAAASGSVVFTERVDRIDAGERHVDLPVAGVFELEGEAIRAWRDYFDLQSYTKAMS